MSENDAQRRNADQSSGLDKLPLPQAQCLSANDTRHVEPVDRSDCNKDQQEVPVERDHQEDDEENEWQRIQRVDEAHHHGIDSAAHVARDSAVRNADDEADDARHHRDENRDLNAEHRSHEQVAAEIIRAEQMKPVKRGPLQQQVEIGLLILVRAEHRTNQRH